MIDFLEPLYHLLKKKKKLYKGLLTFVTLRPGVKLQLQGQIVCRLGVLLLGPTNVKVLGGEVEDLVDRNNQVNCWFLLSVKVDLKPCVFPVFVFCEDKDIITAFIQ